MSTHKLCSVADQPEVKAQAEASEVSRPEALEANSAPLDNAKFLSASPPEARVDPAAPTQL